MTELIIRYLVGLGVQTTVRNYSLLVDNWPRTVNDLEISAVPRLQQAVYHVPREYIIR